MPRPSGCGPHGVVRTAGGPLPAVAGASLELPAGEITGLVGESGSGKSTLALALLNAVPAPGRIAAGSVEVDGVGDVPALAGSELRKARGARSATCSRHRRTR